MLLLNPGAMTTVGRAGEGRCGLCFGSGLGSSCISPDWLLKVAMRTYHGNISVNFTSTVAYWEGFGVLHRRGLGSGLEKVTVMVLERWDGDLLNIWKYVVFTAVFESVDVKVLISD